MYQLRDAQRNCLVELSEVHLRAAAPRRLRLFRPGRRRPDGGYDVDLADRIAEVETGSFWFEARAALIAASVSSETVGSYLEVGCGHGRHWPVFVMLSLRQVSGPPTSCFAASSSPARANRR